MSGIDSLRDAAGRQSSVRPPRRQTKTSTPTEPNDTPGDTTAASPATEPTASPVVADKTQTPATTKPPEPATAEPVTATPAASKPKQRRQRANETPGKKVGDLYYVKIQLSPDARAHLEHLCKTTPNSSHGEQAAGALRRHEATIRAEATPANDTDTKSVIPPRRRMKRLVGGGAKVPATLGLTLDEATGLGKLKDETQFSYSLLVDKALTKDAQQDD